LATNERGLEEPALGGNGDPILLVIKSGLLGVVDKHRDWDELSALCLAYRRSRYVIDGSGTNVVSGFTSEQNIKLQGYVAWRQYV
jgi:hypothetical protein